MQEIDPSQITLQEIEVNDYAQEQDQIQNLVGQIWTRPESLKEALDSINRWGTKKTESGGYFYILLDGSAIGLTGYYITRPEQKQLGLRHHGTSVKGTGKLAFDKLIEVIKLRHPDFRGIIEQIPEGREDLFPIYESWGFKLIKDNQEWEPKKDYFKYVMEKPLDFSDQLD